MDKLTTLISLMKKFFPAASYKKTLVDRESRIWAIFTAGSRDYLAFMDTETDERCYFALS